MVHPNLQRNPWPLVDSFLIPFSAMAGSSQLDLQPASKAAPASGDRRQLRRLYLVEALASHASTLLMLGIFFYMHRRFGWDSLHNLALSASQGFFYVIGALSSHRLSALMGRRRLMRATQCLMSPLVLLAACWSNQWIIVAVLLLYTLLSAAQWPALESLVCSGADAHELSGRISLYNCLWAAVGAATLAVCGTIIEYFPRGLFLLAMAAHAVSAALLWRSLGDTREFPAAPPAPEPRLLAQRTLAMRLSRVALPATYAMMYALSAILPSLSVLHTMPPQWRTAAASVWMLSRFFTFALLGVTIWWHTRPRILPAAALILLLAFLGVVVPSPKLPLLTMILSQIVLGAIMGLIYAASLYFGMVLSEGSTEHGGYHEALIGLGSILGPGAGALAQSLRPGSPAASVIAVSALLGVAALIAAAVSLQSRFKGNR